MSPDKAIRIIDQVYEVRKAGDKDAARQFWADGATYQMAGASRFIAPFPVGPQDAVAAVHQLMDLFTFHEVERLDTIASDDRVAIRWKVKVSRGQDGPPETTEILDLWTLAPDGKVKSLVQFADTALIASQLH